MPERTIGIEIPYPDCAVTTASIYHGEVRRVDSCTYLITFYEADGGFSMIGSWRWNDRRPEVINVVKFKRSTGEERAVSFEDLVYRVADYTTEDCVPVFRVRLFR